MNLRLLPGRDDPALHGNLANRNQAALRPRRWPFRSLRRLARRVTAPVDPTHVLGALLVARLLLSTLVTDDALIVATLDRFRVGHVQLGLLALFRQFLP